METSPLWVLVAAFIGALVPGIFVLLQLGAASKERLEAIYERLLSELNQVVREMGGWDGVENLPDDKKRTISRMLHLHLDSLVASITVEGRSSWRKFWYSRTLMLYNETLGAATYVEEVFHLEKDDLHKDIGGEECLKQYFQKLQEYERGNSDG